MDGWLKKTKLMLYSTLVEVEVEVGVELGKSVECSASFFFEPERIIPISISI